MRRGLPIIIFASMFFALMVLCTKFISSSIPSSEIVFFRSLVGALAVLFYVLVSRDRRALVSGNKRVLFWRGIVGALAQLFWFYSLERIPAASATLLNNSYPIFAVLLGMIFLSESVLFGTVLSLVISVIGLVIVLFPIPYGMSPGYLAGLMSGLFAGIAILNIRKLRETDSAWVIFLSFSFGGLLLSAPFTFYNFINPTSVQWFILFLVGLFSVGGQMFLTYAYKFAAPAEGSTVAMSTTIFVGILGFVFLKEILTLKFIIGASLVLGGGVYLIIKERLVGE